MKYAFIRDNQNLWSIRRLCSTLDVHHSGYYAWLKQPISKTARKRQHLSGLIKQFWLESGGVYGYRKIHYDLKDWGEPKLNTTDELLQDMQIRFGIG